jgi:hypothetical protein
MDMKGLNIAAIINQCVIAKAGSIAFNCSVYGKSSEIIAEFQKKIVIQEQVLKQNKFA